MEGNATFSHLLAPIKIGSMTVRNRMCMPPMGTDLGTRDGYVSQQTLDYYEARAAGGVGLLCVEVGCVDYPRGKAVNRQLAIDDDKYLPGLSELAAVIKKHGASSMIQIHHAGREAHILGLGIQPVGPSAIPSIVPKSVAPRALTTQEVKDMIVRFIDCAERVKQAGFEGVEVHGAHTYLLAQFLSPLCNDRTDEYGGSHENRARMILEIVQGIRQRLGRDYPLSVRLSGEEPVPGGVTIEDTCRTAKMLEDAGVDVISISTGGHVVPKPIVQAPSAFPPGYMLNLPERVKHVVKVPVIGVGRLNTPASAEAALREGKCDIAALGRTLIVDPDFPNKVMQNRPEDVRPCTACMYCFQQIMQDKDFACANNPAVGRERELAITPTAQSKKVFVIGGGIAGMEAARVAALRGHDVTIFEKGDFLGGQLVPAAVPPHKEDLDLLRNYYLSQIKSAGVKTQLGKTMDAATITAGKPDAVIVATGSRPQIPTIRGIDRSNVATAEDVLMGKASVGQRVIVIGGELVGCETAEYLAKQGKQVTIVRRAQKRLASGMNAMVRRMLLNDLEAMNVESMNGVQYEEINDKGLVITTIGGQREQLEADTIVLAAGSIPVRELANELEGKVPVHVIGDAVEPRRFVEAISEGMAAGMAV